MSVLPSGLQQPPPHALESTAAAEPTSKESREQSTGTPLEISTALNFSSPELKTRSFLHIVRHGSGARAVYVVCYHRLDRLGITPKPALAEGAQGLIELLERIGVDFELKEVREALEDILRLGSANIPDLWLSDEELIEKDLTER